ncbi:MAG TPA: twin-arginine translocase TatA/TatE family subunit [Crocinitomicaceae bacterium]|nr:twin-arginine translocase TatA/TatE family subunit [Crocinitomicaceae bacterium]
MLLFLEDIGGSEILLILFVILIFFGPKSIPGIAKTFGKTIYQIKQASDDLKSELSKSGMNIKRDMNLDGIFEDANRNFEQNIVAPVERELNEVDKSLNSISYTKNYSQTPPTETPEELNNTEEVTDLQEDVIVVKEDEKA